MSETLPADYVSLTPASRRILFAAIAVLALLMTMKYFPGLENEPAYAGLAYQSIHPDAFTGDPYRGPETDVSTRIVQLSLVYVLAGISGEIWLDDRFLAVIYLATVVLSLLGIDRIARLFGLTGLYERLTILLLFAKDHAILDHKVLLAHYQGFNHGVFAIPIIIWLYYAALARKGLPLVLALSVLLLGFSLRNAPFAILIAMVIVFFTGTPRDRIAVAILAALGVIAVYIVLFHVMDMPDTDRIRLWEVLRDAAGGDVNPFHDAFWEPLRFTVVNGIWVAVLTAGYLCAPGDKPLGTGIRAAMVTAFLIWLLGGLYISFAPDFLKFPILQGAAPTRALAWPQNIAYLSVFAAGLLYLRQRPAPAKCCLTVAGLAALFILGPGNLGKWALLTAAAAAAALVLAATGPRAVSGRASDMPLSEHLLATPARPIAHAMIVALFIAYAGAAYSKAPAWRTAFQSGVFGDALPAAWIGVTDFVRANTPSSSVILPIAFDDRRQLRTDAEATAPVPRLSITRALGTRTGRAMPIPEDFPGDFRDPDAWIRGNQQKQVLQLIKDALRSRDLCKAAAAVAKLEPVPDYIILPLMILSTKANGIGAYAKIEDVNGYAILKLKEGGHSPCPAS